jgi:hypothetical protein
MDKVKLSIILISFILAAVFISCQPGATPEKGKQAGTEMSGTTNGGTEKEGTQEEVTKTDEGGAVSATGPGEGGATTTGGTSMAMDPVKIFVDNCGTCHNISTKPEIKTEGSYDLAGKGLDEAAIKQKLGDHPPGAEKPISETLPQDQFDALVKFLLTVQ